MKLLYVSLNNNTTINSLYGA